MVNADLLQSYRRQGWAVVDGLLSAAELATARSLIAGLVEGARGLADHNEVYDLEPDHRPDAPHVRRIKAPHKHHAFFRDLIAAPPMLAMLQTLLGTADVRLLGSKINLKQGGGGSAVEWHQDWAFYPHTNDDLLAVGVMIEECTLDNGAMLMLSGSHLGPVHDHHSDGVFCGAIDPAAAGLDVSGASPCVGAAGAVSFHHVRTVHGSAANRSNRPRTLLLYEIAAGDAWPLLGVPDYAEFTNRLLSGRQSPEPRLAPVPVRLPLPPARQGGSIFENQRGMRNAYFGRAER